MKITKIKRMNEKELLHHIIDNTEICDIKYANDGGGNVEVEEEIDEDTVFEILLEIRKSKDIYTYSFESTNEIVGSSTKELHAYIDGEFKLIWKREKGMVE